MPKVKKVKCDILGDFQTLCISTKFSLRIDLTFLFVNTGENVWISLPEMHCPRAQPAVAGLGGLLFVMGGKNSKKVELKSCEVFDPLTNSWTLLEDGLKKKRAAAASVAFREDELLVIGGRS